MQTEKKIIHTLIILIISLLMAVYVINTIGHTGRIRALDALVDEVIMDTASGDLDAAQKKPPGSYWKTTIPRLTNGDMKAYGRT